MSESSSVGHGISREGKVHDAGNLWLENILGMTRSVKRALFLDCKMVCYSVHFFGLGGLFGRRMGVFFWLGLMSHVLTKKRKKWVSV